MTTRKELAQKLAELPTFNLRFGSRVDIFNLPADDRDVIVQALRDAEELAEQSQGLTAEFEKLREKIRTLMVERDEAGAKHRTVAAEHAKLDDKYRALAAENGKLDERYRALAAEHAKADDKHRALATEGARLAEQSRVLSAERARLTERSQALAGERDAALDHLIRIVNGEVDATVAANWLRSTHPDKASSVRPAEPKRGWMAIGTAPKDNSLVNLIGRGRTGRWVAPVATRRNMISSDAGVDHWLDWTHPFAPTHWCPIPEPPPLPPQEAAGQDGGRVDRALDDQAWLNEDLLFLSKANNG
jgi:hypothetical protein